MRLVLFALLAYVAWPRAAHGQQSRAATVERLIRSIPDERTQQFLRVAAANGLLERVLDVILPQNQFVTRTNARVPVARQQSNRPRIPASVLADVRPFSETPVIQAAGPFRVLSSRPGLIVGRVADKPDPVELFYKLPENRQVIGVPPNSVLTITLRDETFGMAQHREVTLLAGDGRPLLYFLSDGSPRPYARSVASQTLRIVQQAPDATGRAPVSIAGTGFAPQVIRVGSRTVVGPVGRQSEFVLLESSVPSEASRSSEGDAYHVTILMYALP